MGFKQKMLILLNRPTVIQTFNKNTEKHKKESRSHQPNLNSDFRRKNPIKIKTEELLNKHEEDVLKKKHIINNALKSQMEQINFRLETRRFSKITKKAEISKKNSLFLGKN